MKTQETEKSPTRRPGLIVLPFLILAGLLLAPPTRSLLKMQGKLFFDSTPFAARIRDFGMTSGPMPTVQNKPLMGCGTGCTIFRPGCRRI